MKFIEDDIAVVGMAGVFPDAPDVEAFWENIVEGRCSISEHPSRETVDRLVDPEAPLFERPYTLRGGYLKDLFRFDPLAFGIMPDSILGGNTNHYMALKLARDALVDAGLDQNEFPRDRTDVIIGSGQYINPGNANWIQHGLVLDQTIDILRRLHPAWSEAQLESIRAQLKAGLPPLNAQIVPALIDNLTTGRIANRLNLNGANYVLDGACSSSLIAIDSGAKNLLLDRCDVALVGGILAGIPPQGVMTFSALGALSRLPALRPFDRGADGTLMGESAGMLVLLRRSDAERAGHRIYAVIKGIGISSDGRAGGLMAPRKAGEVLAIQRAYRDAAVDPASVGLIEAHGTGIPLGDATEMAALTEVFGPRRSNVATCAVGSVKSMIGHALSAAGIAGFIKAALGLYHKVLPPTVNCEEPHPDLHLDQGPFFINTETRPWIHGSAHNPRRAGISAMGFGGINTHCVLEEHA